ncbi:MAG: hypothetical protein JWN24_4451 [Phycisphaerales bacterium]|nr:hypothetical protein [Phycisphaerales bacterium]
MREAIRTRSATSHRRHSASARAVVERLESRTFLTSTPIALPGGSAPGTIEAENYDNGGEGVAYHDTQTVNPGGAYRHDGVGITATHDAGGGYYVGWTHPTEWLQYTVNVAATTTYTLDVRLASINGGTFHFSSDGHAVTGAIKMPNTGGWENWTTVSVPGVNLTAGKHVIRLSFDTVANPTTGIGNINWFRFRDNPATSPRTAWWRAAKYGMFIHWGLYSQLAGHWGNQTTTGFGEWILHDLHIPLTAYESQVPALFNTYAFNAQTWINTAKAAGMNYIVITAKHHDGFSMFNTKVNSYNIVQDTPQHMDPLAALSAACKAAGIHFGVYYSIMDWNHPELATSATSAGAKNPNDPAVINYINNQLKPQIRELITQYNPDVLWFDGEWVPWWNQEYGREIEEFARSLKPGIIINNRVGKRTSTDGDYDTPEQVIPTSASNGRLWETAMTLNDTWGYKDFDTDWKSPATVISNLSDVASKGGNLLLNIGPEGSGAFPPASVNILQQVGTWLNTNGAAIYSTTASPVANPTWGKITRKGNTLYAIVFNWPTTHTLHLAITGTLAHAKLLESGATIPVTSSATGTDLTLPAVMPQMPATVIEIDYSGNVHAV